MRRLAIAMAFASTMLATPAIARDRAGYVGIEGGVLKAEDTFIDVYSTVNGNTSRVFNDAFRINHGTGYDVDVIGGYDWGIVRTEAELSYKHTGISSAEIDTALTGASTRGPFDVNGHATSLSIMGNALLDVGDDAGWSAYIGPGLGFAHVKYSIDSVDTTIVDKTDSSFSGSDSKFAWQIVAGVRKAITANMDLGLKYRFFQVDHLNFGDSSDQLKGKFRSHSLMLSLIYNFAPPPPPPPPPPPAPERGF